jgi:hypothetical protein
LRRAVKAGPVYSSFVSTSMRVSKFSGPPAGRLTKEIGLKIEK